MLGFALYRGIYELAAYSQLGSATDGTGMTWKKLNDPGNGMLTVWVILLIEWPVFMLLPLLIERVRELHFVFKMAFTCHYYILSLYS